MDALKEYEKSMLNTEPIITNREEDDEVTILHSVRINTNRRHRIRIAKSETSEIVARIMTTSSTNTTSTTSTNSTNSQ